MDFTIKKYLQLLNQLQKCNFRFITFSEYLQHNQLPEKFVILRHDVDKQVWKSLRFAKIQHSMGIKGTYYFRATGNLLNEKLIKEIYELGHEIGYHYENMAICKGNHEKAVQDFNKHLKRIRSLVPVKTICMHGSPLSKYDNRDLWKYIDYRDYGIIGETYLDTNFDIVFYLTDTGRKWNGWNSSLRDKLPQQKSWSENNLVYKNTSDIIDSLKKTTFPEQFMITFHPQRWNNTFLSCFFELILQKTKNFIKRLLLLRL